VSECKQNIAWTIFMAVFMVVLHAVEAIVALYTPVLAWLLKELMLFALAAILAGCLVDWLLK